MIRQAAILILLASVAGALTAVFHPRAPVFRSTEERSPLALSGTELAELDPGSICWVDARTDGEFAEGHVDGAIHLSEDAWETGFERLMFAWEPGQTIVVYCDEATCHASEGVAMRLRAELGVEAVYFLEGGLQAAQEVVR